MEKKGIVNSQRLLREKKGKKRWEGEGVKREKRNSRKTILEDESKTSIIRPWS